MKTEIIEKISESSFTPTYGLGGIGVGSMNNGAYAYSIRTEPYRGLEQKPNELCTDYYIQVNSKVRGKAYNDTGKTYTGRVIRILKNSDGSVEALYVRLEKTNKIITLSPEGLELLIPKTIEQRPTYTISPEYLVSTLY